eukprot:Skav231919  [mRNA]  locus=scaffold3547:35938:37448:+ [translate_table: standard]
MSMLRCAVEVDEVMHNTVINALGRSQQAAEAADEDRVAPAVDGFQADAMLQRLSNGNVRADAQTAELTRDTIAYTSVVNAWASSGRMEKARDTFEE